MGCAMRFDLAPSPALANCGSGAASRSADLLSNCLPTCLNGSVSHIGRLLVLAARSGFRLGCLRSQLAYLSPFRGPEGLRQLPVGQILLRQVASQGGLDIVPARPIGASAPCAARPGLGVENFRILFDDPVRVHPPGSRGTEAICNLLRSLKDQEIRRAVATSGEAADGSRSGFVAGTQTEGGNGRRGWLVLGNACERLALRPANRHGLGPVRSIRPISGHGNSSDAPPNATIPRIQHCPFTVVERDLLLLYSLTGRLLKRSPIARIAR